MSRARTYDASRRRADAEDRKRRVIEAAERLFFEHGYGDTSIAMIAEAAGVSAPFVYAAFESKAGILVRIMESGVVGTTEDVGMLREQDAIRDILRPGLDRHERVDALVAAAAGVHQRSARTLKLMDSIAGTDEAVRAEVRRATEASLADAIVFAGSFAAGELRDDLTLQQIGEVMNVVGGFRSYSAFVEDHGWTHEQYISWATDAFTRLLLA